MSVCTHRFVRVPNLQRFPTEDDYVFAITLTLTLTPTFALPKAGVGSEEVDPRPRVVLGQHVQEDQVPHRRHHTLHRVRVRARVRGKGEGGGDGEGEG